MILCESSRFTFIRNAVKYDYPIVEAINSIIPLCDEIIVSVGDSKDETEQLIQSIQSPKIKIYHSQWNDALREGVLYWLKKRTKLLIIFG